MIWTEFILHTSDQLRARCVYGNEASGYKLQEISLLADQLLASQERLSSTEPVT
jgi:hypothetical protein